MGLVCRHVKLVAVGGIGARSAGGLILLRLLVHGANASRQLEYVGRRRRLKSCGLEERGWGSEEPSWLELTLSDGMRLRVREKRWGAALLCLILGMYRYILGDLFRYKIWHGIGRRAKLKSTDSKVVEMAVSVAICRMVVLMVVMMMAQTGRRLTRTRLDATKRTSKQVTQRLSIISSGWERREVDALSLCVGSSVTITRRSVSSPSKGGRPSV